MRLAAETSRARMADAKGVGGEDEFGFGGRETHFEGYFRTGLCSIEVVLDRMMNLASSLSCCG